jgi:CheY-like chemotaxis protein
MQTFRPQLLVSDIAMPGEDGYSLMRRIRALDPTSGGQIPAIAVTAFSRPEDQKEALAAGFTALLGKPLDLTHLMLTLNQLSPFALSRGR